MELKNQGRSLARYELVKIDMQINTRSSIRSFEPMILEGIRNVSSIHGAVLTATVLLTKLLMKEQSNKEAIGLR